MKDLVGLRNKVRDLEEAAARTDETVLKKDRALRTAQSETITLRRRMEQMTREQDVYRRSGNAVPDTISMPDGVVPELQLVPPSEPQFYQKREAYAPQAGELGGGAAAALLAEGQRTPGRSQVELDAAREDRRREILGQVRDRMAARERQRNTLENGPDADVVLDDALDAVLLSGVAWYVPEQRSRVQLVPRWSVHHPHRDGSTLTYHGTLMERKRCAGGFRMVQAPGMTSTSSSTVVREELSKGQRMARDMARLVAELEFLHLTMEQNEIMQASTQSENELIREDLDHTVTMMNDLSRTARRAIDVGLVDARDVEERQAPAKSKRLATASGLAEFASHPQYARLKYNQTVFDLCIEASLRAVKERDEAVREMEEMRAAERERILYFQTCRRDAAVQTLNDDELAVVEALVWEDALAQFCFTIAVEAIDESHRGEENAVVFLSHVPNSLRQHMGPLARGTDTLRTHVSVLKVVNRLYADKIGDDRTADAEGLPRRPLARFVYDAFLAKYGIRAMADTNLVDFTHSLARYRSSCHCCQNFLRFLAADGLHPLLDFALYILDAVRTGPASTTFKTDAGVILVTQMRATRVAQDALAWLAPPDVQAVLRAAPWMRPPAKFSALHPAIENDFVVDVHHLLTLILDECEKEEKERLRQIDKVFASHDRYRRDRLTFPQFEAAVAELVGRAGDRAYSRRKVRIMFTEARHADPYGLMPPPQQQKASSQALAVAAAPPTSSGGAGDDEYEDDFDEDIVAELTGTSGKENGLTPAQFRTICQAYGLRDAVRPPNASGSRGAPGLPQDHEVKIMADSIYYYRMKR